MMSNSLITERNQTMAPKEDAKEVIPYDILTDHPRSSHVVPGPAAPVRRGRPPKKDKGLQAATGPTSGYRDGPDGIIETADFLDGWLPEGWVDTPAKCRNKVKHGDYVKVKVE